MISYTYGTMPTKETFDKQFKANVEFPGHYTFITKGTDAYIMGSGNYTADELFSALTGLMAKWNCTKYPSDAAEIGNLVSAILSTLEIEWI